MVRTLWTFRNYQCQLGHGVLGLFGTCLGFIFYILENKTSSLFGDACLLYLLTYTANSAQIWWNFLPVYHRSFKKAGCFIFQYVKNKAQTGPEQPQASGISCSLILLNRSFK